MRRALLAMLMLCASLGLHGQSPVLRATLEPSKGIIVGQAVHLNVTVLVPNYFTGSVDLPVFELENAIIVQPQDRPLNIHETIGGISYAGISQSYTIYPQQAGEFRLPAAQFTVPYAKEPPKTVQALLSLPPLTFHADIPAAARGLDYFLPTTKLTLEQRWDKKPKEIRAGDTLRRTISITTVRAQAMLIPPVPLEASDGIRVYAEEPTVLDQKTSTGEFVDGRRIQSARYFFRKEGEYTLPAIEVQWWNLNSNKLVTSTLPPVHFTVEPNPGYVAELPPEKEPVVVAPPEHVSVWKRYRFWIRIVLPCAALSLLLLWLAWRCLPLLFAWLKAVAERRRSSERSYHRQLIRACRRNDARQSYGLLLQWLAKYNDGMSLRNYLHLSNDDALTSAVDELGAALYSDHPENWNGDKLAQLLQARHGDETRQRASRRSLPALNPGRPD